MASIVPMLSTALLLLLAGPAMSDWYGQDCTSDKNQPDWMCQFKDRTFMSMRLPGTHDSGTYQFANGTGADGEPFWLYTAGFVWAQTQGCTVYNQLLSGIRFLDIRLSWNTYSSMVVVSHSYQTVSFEDVLHDIANFMSAHSCEVLVMHITDDTLDAPTDYLQSMKYSSTDNSQHTQWEIARNSINNILGVYSSLGDTVIPGELLAQNPTLGQLTGSGKRFVIISAELAYLVTDNRGGMGAIEPSTDTMDLSYTTNGNHGIMRYQDSWVGNDSYYADQVQSRLQGWLTERLPAVNHQTSPDQGVFAVVKAEMAHTAYTPYDSAVSTNQVLFSLLDCATYPEACKAFNVWAMDFPNQSDINRVIALNDGGALVYNSQGYYGCDLTNWNPASQANAASGAIRSSQACGIACGFNSACKYWSYSNTWCGSVAGPCCFLKSSRCDGLHADSNFASGAAPVPAQWAGGYYGCDLPGWNPTTAAGAGSPQACAIACTATAGCKFWTHSTTWCGSNSPPCCFLKSSTCGGLHSDSNFVSGANPYV